MVNKTAMRADTDKIISDWAETVTIKRATKTSDSMGQLEESSWNIVQQDGQDTIDVDVQPGGSARLVDKKGVEHKVDYRVFLPYDADIEMSDRIYWDSVIMLVMKAEKNPDHIEVLANKV